VKFSEKSFSNGSVNVVQPNMACEQNGKEERMIPEIKKILYATDLTKNSAYAFFYAAIWQEDITRELSFYTLSNAFIICLMMDRLST